MSSSRRSITRLTRPVGAATRWNRGLALALGLFVACSPGDLVRPPTTLPPDARLILGPVATALTPGLSQQLLLIVTDGDGVPIDVSVGWASSDPQVASVSAAGLVVARRLGTVVVTATVGARTAQSRIVVQSAAVTTSALVDHPGVTATLFWVGEGADASNAYISNAQSAFDAHWLAHFGGVDAPSPRTGYLPAGFTPAENPFYVALPYSDFDDNGKRKQNAALVIPWAAARTYQPLESMVKNRWVRVTSVRTGRSCYAQWEDAGPGIYDDFQYVFGMTAPANPFAIAGLSAASALDVSPAVRDCLGLNEDIMRLSWRFVEDADVAPGPWTSIVTRR